MKINSTINETLKRITARMEETSREREKYRLAQPKRAVRDLIKDSVSKVCY